MGVASAQPVSDPGLLIQMRDTMTHRGPDDAGVWWSPDARVGLAHRRLSIIDLSLAGHQPMSYLDGQVWLVLNGEIYNYRDLRRTLEAAGHRFRSATDTEVILAAYAEWGLDCLSRLNGMFAFALYDQRARRLFLARDRAGEKPLFYVHRPGTFAFASELKALLRDDDVPRHLDLEAFGQYLAYGYVPGTMCILSGVRKLGQGEAISYEIESGTVRVWQYWQLPEAGEAPRRAPADLERELEALLADSVRMRLVADVPVGILLSGGIDSSLVTAMAARASNGPVKTFTVSFPGYGEYDEAPHARAVADYFGTCHTELVAEPASVELLPQLASQFDEPIADSSMIPTYLVSRLIREHATVALGGDGGDELFGGYRHYNWLQTQDRIRRVVPRVIRKSVGTLAARGLPIGFRGRNYLLGFESVDQGIAHVNVFFDRRSRRRILSKGLRRRGLPGLPPETYKAHLAANCGSVVRKATTADFRSYLVDDILVKVDRASMLTSLEVRAPLVDHRLIEFAFARVPDRLRATSTQRKVLLRSLAKKVLPPGFDLTRKQGFSLPLDAWLRGSWRDNVQEILEQADSSLFDRQGLRELISLQRRGYPNAQRVFAIAMFELWRRHYHIEVTA